MEILEDKYLLNFIQYFKILHIILFNLINNPVYFLSLLSRKGIQEFARLHISPKFMLNFN